jgi:hypothetical protein
LPPPRLPDVLGRLAQVLELRAARQSAQALLFELASP